MKTSCNIPQRTTQKTSLPDVSTSSCRRWPRRFAPCGPLCANALPTANELVYDNYNFFVIGYSSTLRPSDCFAQLVADAHGVRLAFYYGSKLPDPAGILHGRRQSEPIHSARKCARFEQAGG